MEIKKQILPDGRAKVDISLTLSREEVAFLSPDAPAASAPVLAESESSVTFDTFAAMIGTARPLTQHALASCEVVEFRPGLISLRTDNIAVQAHLTHPRMLSILSNTASALWGEPTTFEVQTADRA